MPPGAASYAEVKQNLPGWSLARDGPREPKKQGWQCPAPTVQDWEDYKQWKEEQAKKEELPAAPQIFLADSALLFYQDPDVQLPWIHRLKCELPRRVGRLSGELPVKASYIGFGTKDEPEFYELFKRTMTQIGVVLCRQIHHPPNRFEIAHLEQSDLILVGGGDRKRLWETLGTDIGGNAVAEHVKWRYLQGAVVIAVGEAMSLLGEKSWYLLGEKKTVVPFTGWKIFPHVVASEAEEQDLEELVEQLGGAGVVVLGIYQGGGMIFNRDGLVEPVRQMITEYRWDWQSESVKRALLLGPPRGTGLICPLYAATRGGGEESEGVDAFAYALTQEEEREEEHLMEQFDTCSAWLLPEAKNEVERLKQMGNEAFKAGKADLANINYEQARVLLESSARMWSELGESPSHDKSSEAAPLLTSLLLNLCASHLLAHEQDQRGRGEALLPTAPGVLPEVPTPGAEAEAEPMTLIEVRDNLVVAFRAANEALQLSGGQSAKAWYRRGLVFERMRDPRNAERDLEQALARAPGDKSITKKRGEVKELASKVAENMYYARHKELDAQEARLQLPTRRALQLQGSFCDVYCDERCEFALAQPLARVVDSELEEVEGRPKLSLAAKPAEGAAYLHPHALWTWEFLVQRAAGLQLLQIEDVDLGSGPLEWLCKGLRTHSEVRVLRLVGVHLGPTGARMLRNVLAQSKVLIQVALDACGLLDAGLSELAAGLQENGGQLEALSLKRNHFTPKRIGTLADVLCAEAPPGLLELDLSDNPLGAAGAKEVARVVASGAHRLQALVLQGCLLDLVAFWRLVGNLNDARPLARLDLRRNPIGRGTRRCWRGQMGPTIRCDVLLSDHPLKLRKEALQCSQEHDKRSYPLPGRWF